jgi:hypothetical protein
MSNCPKPNKNSSKHYEKGPKPLGNSPKPHEKGP